MLPKQITLTSTAGNFLKECLRFKPEPGFHDTSSRDILLGISPKHETRLDRFIYRALKQLHCIFHTQGVCP